MTLQIDKPCILKFEIDSCMSSAELTRLIGQISEIMVRHSPPNIPVDRIHTCSRDIALIIGTWLNPNWTPPTVEQWILEKISDNLSELDKKKHS